MAGEIKHILYETGVEERFLLIAGDKEYPISKPQGWDDMDCTVDINEEYFNVDNFILGDKSKLTFSNYVEDSGYDLIKKVYDDEGGDGKILFKWQAVKDGVVADILGDGYEINLNKYEHTFDRDEMKIETEIKKREAQNKILNREDISVNLFSETNLDKETVTPLETKIILYKEGSRKKTNFYFYSIDQVPAGSGNKWFFSFMRGDSPELLDGAKPISGYYFLGFSSVYNGPMFTARFDVPNVSVEISNFEVKTENSSGQHIPVTLYAIKENGATEVGRIALKKSDTDTKNIKITNEVFDIGSLKSGESLRLLMLTDNGQATGFLNADEQASIKISSNLSSPLRKARVVMLKDAVRQIARMYAGEGIGLKSGLIDNGGAYENTAISTGFFLRGVADMVGLDNKLTTSLKKMVYDGLLPLFAGGIDVQQDKIVIDDIRWFFKDRRCYDLTGYDYSEEDFVLANDIELSYNQLLFGSKKYSTGKTKDILNGNTELEASTPLKTVKNKLDKRTDFIIDEDKIQDIILDTSTASRSTDDDLVLIDLVEVENYEDEGVLTNAVHANEDGYLWIYSYENPFDTLPITVGNKVSITSGLNTGSWEVLEISRYKAKFNKTAGIQTGQSETPIKFIIPKAIKNRTNENFIITGAREAKVVSNVRHNPKYQMARWFPYFGGAFEKKKDTDEIIITDYKNNGEISVQPNSDSMRDEIQGLTVYNKNETLGRLRQNRLPIFNNQRIEVTLIGVEFYIFLDVFNTWRYADNKSRGYISVNTPFGMASVYPMGSGAIKYDKEDNRLTIKGRLKSLSTKYKIFDQTFDETFE